MSIEYTNNSQNYTFLLAALYISGILFWVLILLRFLDMWFAYIPTRTSELHIQYISIDLKKYGSLFYSMWPQIHYILLYKMSFLTQTWSQNNGHLKSQIKLENAETEIALNYLRIWRLKFWWYFVAKWPHFMNNNWLICQYFPLSAYFQIFAKMIANSMI